MKLQVYPEWCCDICNEIIHNHIDCPACKEKNAPSSAYGELTSEDKEISCDLCGALFKLKSGSWYSDCKVSIVNEKEGLL